MKSQLLLPVLGSFLTLSVSQGMAQSWGLTGEAGTIPGTHFLGTTDNKALEIKVNGLRAMRVEPTSSAGANIVSANIIGGWKGNFVAPGLWGATIGGGGLENGLNVILGQGNGAVIAGGYNNTNQGPNGAIGGGFANVIDIDAWSSTIAGGSQNRIDASANSSSISGGWSNVIGGACYSSVIGGGRKNVIVNSSPGSVVGGGYFNRIDGGADYATIGGGSSNVIPSNRGNNATIPGGSGNTADGFCSFAAGYLAQALHPGTFVWADYHDGNFASTGDNQFLIRAEGGVGIGTSSPGAQLDVAGEIHCTVLELTSDRNAKTGFQSVSPRAVLDKVVQLPLSTWQYTNAPAIRHIGPMAQDFKAAFPNLGADDTHIASVDADGVALASIQALHEMVREKDTEIASLQQEVSQLKSELAKVNSSVAERLAALEKSVSKSVFQAGLNPVSSR